MLNFKVIKFLNVNYPPLNFSFELKKMSFVALKMSFEALKTGFEVGHGQRGLRRTPPARPMVPTRPTAEPTSWVSSRSCRLQIFFL